MKLRFFFSEYIHYERVVLSYVWRVIQFPRQVNGRKGFTNDDCESNHVVGFGSFVGIIYKYIITPALPFNNLQCFM